MVGNFKLFSPMNHKSQIILEVDGDQSELYENLKDKPLNIEIKELKEKRSLSANAYYWTLCAKLAEAVGRSKPEMHNLLLRRYGQTEEIGGKTPMIAIPDTDEAEKTALQSDTFHLRQTSKTIKGNDGTVFRYYLLLKGSSCYDKSEMKALIDGTISECRECGIQTLTPEELALLNYER